MRCIILISSLMTFTFHIIATETTNETGVIQLASNTDVQKLTKEANISLRHGRQLESQFFEMKPRVQIIKIPSHVTKVKLIGPYTDYFPQNVLKLRRSFVANPGTNAKSQTYEDYNYFIKDTVNLDSKKEKRNLKRQRVAELAPEDYYNEENFSYDQNIYVDRPVKNKRFKNTRKDLKSKKKNLSEVYGFHTKRNEGDMPVKDNYEDYKIANTFKSEEDSEEYYDFEPAASTHYGQRSPSTLQKIKTTSPVKMMKPNYLKEKSALTKYGNDYFPAMESKSQHSKKEPFFHQHYTSHNPYVVTNFGLSDANNIQQHSTKVLLVDPFKKLGQQAMAGSEQVLNTLPITNPGIQVIQPPQFRDVSFSRPNHPSRSSGSTQQNTETGSNQKATISDILEQDCPSYETIGFCESPPRYPMHQIKNIIKKCATILEAMNTQNFEDQKTAFGFSKRLGFATETENGTTATEPESERLISKKKILSDGGAACHSDIFLTEPGYAREVISGKWFVVVQDSDVLQQKIVTDTCVNSGKPCAGLKHLNCNRLGGNDIKSTRCIQRFSYQKLISWDPDFPDSCPKIRVFKFPSACVCHLGPL